MTTQTEALKSAIEFAEYCLEELDLSHMASNQAKRLIQKSKEALAQPEQEPVAWRYKPVREDNPRWEYTTNHPLDMGDGYLRPSLVEYCKCIEPLYAKEKPKLMLEKFREMKDLLNDTTPPQPKEPEQEPVAWRELCRRLYVELFHCNEQMTHGSRPKWKAGKEVPDVLADAETALNTTPPQRTWVGLTDDEIEMIVENRRAAHWEFVRQVEAKLKEKNT